jgi:signal transduction histidine kinase
MIKEIPHSKTDFERGMIETEQFEATNVDLYSEIAEHKKIERTLSERNIELLDAAKAKDLFLANMSHELRTPLNGIIGFAEFLADGKPGLVNPKQKEYLQDILNSGRQLLQLIGDVMDLAKMGAGKMEINPEKFFLRQAIEETCVVAKAIAQKKGIYIKVNVAPEIAAVTLDQKKLKQVVYALLSNAIKFNHDQGNVEICAERPDIGHVVIVVKDTGIGIQEQDLLCLFDEFVQPEPGAASHREGPGLGLRLIRRLVELQGGTIGVQSEVGKGSTVTVVLPIAGC